MVSETMHPTEHRASRACYRVWAWVGDLEEDLRKWVLSVRKQGLYHDQGPQWSCLMGMWHLW